VTINRLQQRLHGIPRQRAWELLETVQSWRVDRGIEARWALAFGGQKTEKTAQVGDEVLLGAPTQPPGTQAYEGLDPTRAEAPKASGCRIVIEVAEKP